MKKWISICAVAVAMTVRAFDENFDSVPAHSLPAGWDAETVEWAVDAGVLRKDGGADYTFAMPEMISPGEEVVVEATVRVEKRATKGWLAAAVAIRQNEGNYWHLGLIEAPKENGSRHMAELVEKCDDVWHAQNETQTKLTSTGWDGGNFAWEYNHPYRLRLAMNAAGIDGTISELDGMKRAHFGFAFDKPAVTWGAPALGASSVVASFDDFHADVVKPHAVEAAKKIPAYDVPGGDEAKGRATGFFHTQNIGGRDWIIDPNGKAFYFVGTDHVSYRGHWCEKLGYAPYARVAEKKYTNENAWAETAIARLKAWNFNTLATGNSPSLRHRGLPYIEFIAFGSSFAAGDGLCEKTTWTGFPNVFSPEWPRHCEILARKKCAALRDDPWLLGYFLDNELEWYGKHYSPRGLFDEAWKKPADHSAKKALVEFVKKQAGSIEKFNAGFGTTFANFDALAADTTPHEARNEAGIALGRDFVRLIAELYFKGCSEALKKADPNHMNLGCRFAGQAPDVWDIAGKYCDIVSLNTYPMIDVERGVRASFQEQIEKWHALAGKPMAITEWSFPALDAGLPSRHGAGMRVDSQAQRAKCFSFLQDFFFREPFIVGSSYFMYLDEPALGISASFPEDSNYGLVDGNDNVWPELTAAATAINREANRHHLDGNFQPAKLAGSAEPAAWLCEAKEDIGEHPYKRDYTTGHLGLSFPQGGSKWTMTLDGKTVAELFPLLHVVDGSDFWLHPVSGELVARYENKKVVAMVVAFDFTPDASGPRKGRVLMRYWIPKGDEGWIASQCLRVENSGTKSWKLGDLFHAQQPKTGSDPAKIETLNDVPSYYRTVCGWVDREKSIIIGGWHADGKLGGEYWKDCPQCFHADIHEKIDVSLEPGAMWKGSDDLAFFFAIPGTARDAHAAFCERIAREAGFR